MDVYICNECGAEIKNTQPEECPLCRSNDFSKHTRDDPSDKDLKEHDLMEEATEELDRYDEGTELRDPKFNYRCPCEEHDS